MEKRADEETVINLNRILQDYYRREEYRLVDAVKDTMVVIGNVVDQKTTNLRSRIDALTSENDRLKKEGKDWKLFTDWCIENVYIDESVYVIDGKECVRSFADLKTFWTNNIKQ